MSERAPISRQSLMVALSALLWCSSVSVGDAKLPPPSPEAVAKVVAEAEKTKARAADEQAALTRAQDRIAAQYQNDLRQRGIAPPLPTPTGQTPQANLPKTAVEPARAAGPRGGNTQSAESHSGSAK